MLLGCAAAFSVQILLIDRHCGQLDGVKLNCIQATVVTVLSLPFALLMEQIRFQDILSAAMPLAYAGILSMGVAYSLQIVGQRHTPPATAPGAPYGGGPADEPGVRFRRSLRLAAAPRDHDGQRALRMCPGLLCGDPLPAAGAEGLQKPNLIKQSPDFRSL